MGNDPIFARVMETPGTRFRLLELVGAIGRACGNEAVLGIPLKETIGDGFWGSFPHFPAEHHQVKGKPRGSYASLLEWMGQTKSKRVVCHSNCLARNNEVQHRAGYSGPAQA